MDILTIIGLTLGSIGIILNQAEKLLVRKFFSGRYLKSVKVFSSICVAVGIILTTTSSKISDHRLNKIVTDFSLKLDKIIYDTIHYKNFDSLLILENEFNKWAKNFVADKDLNEIELQKQKLSTLEKDVRIEKKWSSLYSYIVQTVESIIKSYTKESNEEILYMIKPNIMSNVFDEQYNDSSVMAIIFKDSVIWNLKIIHPMIKMGEYPLPDLKIEILYNRQPKPDDISYFLIGPHLNINDIEGNNQLYIIARTTNNRKVKIVPENNPLDSYRSYLGDYLIKMFEYQVLSIH